MHRRLNRIAKNLVLGSLAYFFSADAPRGEDYGKPPKIVAYVDIVEHAGVPGNKRRHA